MTKSTSTTGNVSVGGDFRLERPCPFVGDMVFLAVLGLALPAAVCLLFQIPPDMLLFPCGGVAVEQLTKLGLLSAQGIFFPGNLLWAFLSWAYYLILCAATLSCCRERRWVLIFFVFIAFAMTCYGWLFNITYGL